MVNSSLFFLKVRRRKNVALLLFFSLNLFFLHILFRPSFTLLAIPALSSSFQNVHNESQSFSFFSLFLTLTLSHLLSLFFKTLFSPEGVRRIGGEKEREREREREREKEREKLNK